MFQEFVGNNNHDTLVTNFLGELIHAECIRLTVLDFTSRPSLRFDLIGLASMLSFAKGLRTVNKTHICSHT